VSFTTITIVDYLLCKSYNNIIVHTLCGLTWLVYKHITLRWNLKEYPSLNFSWGGATMGKKVRKLTCTNPLFEVSSFYFIFFGRLHMSLYLHFLIEVYVTFLLILSKKYTLNLYIFIRFVLPKLLHIAYIVKFIFCVWTE
jgi:hypothetical protein